MEHSRRSTDHKSETEVKQWFPDQILDLLEVDCLQLELVVVEQMVDWLVRWRLL